MKLTNHAARILSFQTPHGVVTLNPLVEETLEGVEAEHARLALDGPLRPFVISRELTVLDEPPPAALQNSPLARPQPRATGPGPAAPPAILTALDDAELANAPTQPTEPGDGTNQTPATVAAVSGSPSTKKAQRSS